MTKRKKKPKQNKTKQKKIKEQMKKKKYIYIYIYINYYFILFYLSCFPHLFDNFEPLRLHVLYYWTS